ncbi:hypothetical protein M885DRAFT_509668 [Pelagophyceae sp. CCMP2097]|nr:hypothetical protein M885DRAFT_509668 [Pelagophyceae sp. CCMP2097]
MQLLRVSRLLRLLLVVLRLCERAAADDFAMGVDFTIGTDEPGLVNVLGLEGVALPVLIASIHRLGLANRLRALASASALAVDSDMELYVDWRPSSGCNATLEDLFNVEELPFQIYKGSKQLVTNLLEATVDATRHRAHAWTARGRSVTVIRSHGVRLDALEQWPRVAVLLDPRGQFAVFGVPCQEFYSRKRRFYASLKRAAAESVRRGLGAIWARGLLGGPGLVVGMHVRAYDAAHDWPAVAPQARGEAGEGQAPQAAVTWDVASPVETHFNAAKDVFVRPAYAIRLSNHHG